MDKKLKRMWIAALRSGEFKQERNALYTGYGYCCLGVLAVQAGAKPDLEHHMRLNGKSVQTMGEYLQTGFIEGLDHKTQELLGLMNDGKEGYRKHNFKEIADWVKKNL